MHYPRVKYQFINNHNGEVYDLPDDPKGWDKSDRNIKRSRKNLSLYREYSKNLQFAEKSKAKLDQYFLAYDVEADITLNELRIIPNAIVEEYYVHTSGELDFIEYGYGDNYAKVPFRSGGLEKLISAQITQMFDVQRLKSITGVELAQLELIDILLTSREILLISEWRNLETVTNGFGFTGQFRTVLMDLISNSDTTNVSGVYGDDFIPWTLDTPFNENDLNPEPDHFFYTNNDTYSKQINLDIQYEVNVSGPSTLRFYAAWIGKVDVLGNFTQFEQIFDSGGLVSLRNFNVNYQGSFTVEPTEKLILVTNVGSNGSGNSNILSYIDFKFIQSENSQTPTTTTVGLFMHEAMEQLIRIITGEEGLYYSETFGGTRHGYAQNGPNTYIGITLGLWIRQFFEKKLELSVQECLDSTDTVQNTGFGVYKINGKERFVHEPLRFFFQDTHVIDLGDVEDLEVDVAKDMYYSGTEFGFKNPSGDNLYEEAMGLDEPNVLTKWTQPITRSDKTYKKISPMRTDGYGKAFASRKPKLNFPQQDTRYDKEKFMLDLKAGMGEAYEEVVWQDLYSQQPTGVFSPDTATGLNFTPYRCSERHEWLYGAGLRAGFFQDKFINHASSKGNETLQTKKSTEAEPISESGDKKVLNLNSGPIVLQTLKFKKVVDYRISQLLDGFTNVNGREIPNIYFKIKIRYKGRTHYGYMLECKPNGVGQWELLKAK